MMTVTRIRLCVGIPQAYLYEYFEKQGFFMFFYVCSAGVADRQHLSRHRYRQRDAGSVLCARRVHGRRGRGPECPVRRQETVDARFRQVENVRHAHDRSGKPTSAGVAGWHPVPAVRGAWSSAGGHRHLPRCGVHGPGQPDVPAEGVAEQVG